MGNPMSATLQRGAIGPVSVLVAGLVISAVAPSASAQGFKEPFSFNNRDHTASMAVYMREMDDQNGGIGIGAGSIDDETLVCAGTGPTSSTSAGNILCVMAGQGANVFVGSDQNSEGDQSSNAETQTTTADEINDILYGGQ